MVHKIVCSKLSKLGDAFKGFKSCLQSRNLKSYVSIYSALIKECISDQIKALLVEWELVKGRVCSETSENRH